MATFLVVKTLDLSAPQGSQMGYASLAVPASMVRASFDGGAPAGMAQASEAGKPLAGVFELPIPPGAKKIEVSISDTGETVQISGTTYWSMKQALLLQPTKPPTLKFDGTQHVNSRNLANHTRGTDFTVELFVNLGQLRDGFIIYQNQAGLDFSFQPAPVPHLATPILNPNGFQIMQTNFTLNPAVTPIGQLFIAERTTVPRVVAVFRPAGMLKLKYPVDQPFPYHLFFHPSIPWTDPYPEGFNYGEFIQRYLLTRRVQVPGRVVDTGKHMVHQHVDAGDKMIFVMPVGSQKDGMGDLLSQSAVFRLLQEINYWMQRLDQVALPLAPIGPVAMSGFSFGATFLAAVLQGARNTLFFDKLLKEIYTFDGVFQEPVLGPNGKPFKPPKTKESEKTTSDFAVAVKAWLRGGSDGRAIRIYTQRSYWFENFKDAIPGTAPTIGPNTAKEVETASSTVLLLPLKFWKAIDNTMTSASAHQEFPARFMEHAIERSALKASPAPPGPNLGGSPKISTATPLPPGVNGTVYPNVSLTSNGGTPPFKWTIKAPALPAGMTLSPDGIVGGTPTVEGPSNVLIEVEDSLGLTDAKGFDLFVKPKCFIIGAAFGSQLSPEVKELWNIRENFLNRTRWGRAFFNRYWSFYYRISPAIAKEMEQDSEMRELIRWTIVEPWVNYMKLLLARPDWDSVAAESLDPSVREFLTEARRQMERWMAEIELPEHYSDCDPFEAVEELNVLLTYALRSGGMAYLDRLHASGELPLRFDPLSAGQLRDLLIRAGRSEAERLRILGPDGVAPVPGATQNQ